MIRLLGADKIMHMDVSQLKYVERGWGHIF